MMVKNYKNLISSALLSKMRNEVEFLHIVERERERESMSFKR